MTAELCLFVFFFFKQKTAYEMRISDWSSDVCSSDLRDVVVLAFHLQEHAQQLHRRTDAGRQVRALLQPGALVRWNAQASLHGSQQSGALPSLCHVPGAAPGARQLIDRAGRMGGDLDQGDRKSTRLNSSHLSASCIPSSSLTKY